MKEITMTAEAPETAPQELDRRVSDGIHVTLLWHPATDRVTVVVHDDALGEPFEIEAPEGRAMDVFHHPFAYAAFEGTEFTTRMREPVGV
jgi:hypothetical protein